MANCSVFWRFFTGSLPDSLIQFFIFYCYVVCFVGLVCNCVVVWCVVGCPKTRKAVKVLLCALFSTTLLMCLVVMPFMAQLSISKLWCDVKVSKWVIEGFLMVYVTLTEMEVFCILVMAFLRTLAVWSPRRHHLKLRTSIALVVVVTLYATLTTMALMVPYWVGFLDAATGKLISRAFTVLHFLVPVALILACYASMIVAVRRNTHRLETTPDTAATGQVMDQATRAMLAVFISNLLLGLPHSIYHVLPNNTNVFIYVIVHTVFYAHLFFDPLAFLCSNRHHRQRVVHTLKSCLGRVKSLSTLPGATSTLPLHLKSSTSTEMSRENHS